MTSVPSEGALGAAGVDQTSAADCPGIFLNALARRVPPSDMILDFPLTLPVTTRRTLMSFSLTAGQMKARLKIAVAVRLQLGRDLGQPLQHVFLLARDDIDGDLLVADRCHPLCTVHQFRTRPGKRQATNNIGGKVLLFGS